LQLVLQPGFAGYFSVLYSTIKKNTSKKISGGTTIYPSDVTYLALALTGDIVLEDLSA